MAKDKKTLDKNTVDGVNKTKLSGSSPSKPKRGDGLADLMARSLNRDAENTKKYHGKRLKSGSQYEKADIVAQTSVGRLAAENMMAGKGLGASLKQALGDKFKSIGIRAKSKVDPLNVLSKISPLAATYYGKKRNRDLEDISYFTGLEVPERATATNARRNIPVIENAGSTSNVSANINGVKTPLGALKKLYNILYIMHKEDKQWRDELRKQSEIDRSFQEEKDYENEKKMRAMKALGLSAGNSYFSKDKNKRKDSPLDLPWKEILEVAGIGAAGYAGNKFIKGLIESKQDVKALENKGIKYNEKTNRWHDTRPGQKNKMLSKKEIAEVLKDAKMTKGILPKILGPLNAAMLGYDVYSAVDEFKNAEKYYGPLDEKQRSNKVKERQREVLNSANPFINQGMDVEEAEQWNKERKQTAKRINKNPSTVKEREETAMNFFKSEEGGGWTHDQAAGIVANLKAESKDGTLSPTSEHPTSHAYGIGQWLGSRVQDFKEFTGKELRGSSFMDQLRFVTHELLGKEWERAGSKLRNAKSAKEATDIMMKDYERPSDLEQEQSIEKRQGFAQKLADVGIMNSPSTRMNTAVSENQSLKTDSSVQSASAPVVINNNTNVSQKQGAGNQQISSAEPRNKDPVYVRLQYQNVRTV